MLGSRRLMSAALAGMWVAGCASAPNAPRSTPTAPTMTVLATTTADPGFAASAFARAAGLMSQADNADIAKQNSQDEATSIGSIYDRVIVHRTFDQRLQSISFPSSAVADVRTVVSADAALEQALGTLAANRNDINTYSSIFATVVSLQTAFIGALTTLAHDLRVSLG
jgi:3-keto-L-gulonate-6-phosphate decarboxylase